MNRRTPVRADSRTLASKLSPAVVEIAKRDRAELLRTLPPVARFAAAPFIMVLLQAFAPIITRIATELFAAWQRRSGGAEALQAAPLESTDVHAFLAANPRFLDELTK